MRKTLATAAVALGLAGCGGTTITTTTTTTASTQATTQASPSTPDMFPACANTVQSYLLMGGAYTNYLGGSDTGQLYNDATAVETDLQVLVLQAVTAQPSNYQEYQPFASGAGWAGNIALFAQQNGDIRQAGSAPQGLVAALKMTCWTSWAQGTS